MSLVPVVVQKPLNQPGELSIWLVTARGVSFQLAGAAYLQFTILPPWSSSQAGSLRHDQVASPRVGWRTTTIVAYARRSCHAGCKAASSRR